MNTNAGIYIRSQRNPLYFQKGVLFLILFFQRCYSSGVFENLIKDLSFKGEPMVGVNYKIRELIMEDFHNGFIDCLRELTTVGDITEDMFKKTFNERQRIGIMTVVAVEANTNRILGTASMFYEPKFIRGCSVKAYIEDVCVASYAQKMGIGKGLVSHLQKRALSDNCYKILLTCNDENVDFYKKLFFERKESAMALYKNNQ